MNSKVKILYLDDEAINLQLFKIHFNKNYEVFLAEDGAEGLDALDKNPDILLVISDMRMPKMTGIEFIREAKKRYPEKKYFILTGFGITSEISEALTSGLILDYFGKPFNINKITKAFSKAL